MTSIDKAKAQIETIIRRALSSYVGANASAEQMAAAVKNALADAACVPALDITVTAEEREDGYRVHVEATGPSAIRVAEVLRRESRG